MGITMLPLALLYFLGILFSVVAQMTNRRKET
jgi:Sec-independent protein secretion pathway component TatC